MSIPIQVYLWLSEAWREGSVEEKIAVIAILLFFLIVLLLLVWLILMWLNPQPTPVIHLNGSCQSFYRYVQVGKTAGFEKIAVCP